MTNTTAQTFTREQAKAHDAVTYALVVDLTKAARTASYKLDCVHKEAGDREVNRSKRYGYADWQWSMSDEEAIAKVQAIVADPKGTYAYGTGDNDDAFYAYIGSKAAETLDEYRVAVARVNELNAQIAEREQVFAAQRWSRFEVVPGGHIHNRNATCHTLRPTTRVAWIAELSGDTEADAVQAYGPALCSHCFKSAPVAWLQQAKVAKDSEGNPLTVAEAQRIADEKAAKKAAREAKKAAKAAR